MIHVTQCPDVYADSLYRSLLKASLNPEEAHLIDQSYYAFVSAKNDTYDQEGTAWALNGEVVSDSESDNPESYTGVSDPLSDRAKQLVAKKHMHFYQAKGKEATAKGYAERHFLSCRVSKKVSKTLQDCPSHLFRREM